MKNNPGTCWRIILWLFACKFRDVINDKSTQDIGSPRCFIVDDSTLRKSGRLIEKVSYVWDHVSRRSILGFKLLVAGYWVVAYYYNEAHRRGQEVFVNDRFGKDERAETWCFV